jgi:hypothetical protein
VSESRGKKLIFATALVSSVVPGALVLSAAAALAVVLRPLAGRRLFGLRQELIQTKRILLVLLELHRTAARRRVPVRPAEFLVRNKSGETKITERLFTGINLISIG